MSTVCSKCKKQVGGMENYGNKSEPLCYECANNKTCANCGRQIGVNDQLVLDGKLLCSECNKVLSKQASKSRVEAESVPSTPADRSSRMSIVKFVLSCLFFLLFVSSFIQSLSAPPSQESANSVYTAISLLISSVFFCTGTIIAALNKLSRRRN